MPRPDFPKTIFEFNQWFSDEDACVRFLIQSRWPDGFACPRCGHSQYYWLGHRKLLQCKQCGYQVSPTAGTVMHRSKMPLTVWFQAAYLITTHTTGMTALQFQRQAGGLTYETAFTMLHKLRSAMVRVGCERLGGVVEVDDTYFGSAHTEKHDWETTGKVIVVGVVDIKKNRANSIRLMVVPDVTSATLAQFVKTNVEEGSTVITDDWESYSGLEKDGYQHIVNPDEMIHTDRVFSNLKTWLLETHRGAVKGQHLQAYLNEYIFRFNYRGTPAAAFQTVLGLAMQRVGPTYKDLYGIAKGEAGWAHPANPIRS